MNAVDNYILSVVNGRAGKVSHTFEKQVIADLLQRAVDIVDWNELYARVSWSVTRPYILMESDTSFTIYYVQTPRQVTTVNEINMTGNVNYII